MKRAAEKRPAADAKDRYIAEIDRFAGMLREQEEAIRANEREVAVTKLAYEKSREALREAEKIQLATVGLLLKFIRPGSIDILPLFDQMEPADEELQGTGAAEWRNEPIVVLSLSAVALRALIDADIVLVGQLQDRILAGNDWPAAIEGISEPMAQAIEAKLAAYIDSKATGKK